jgi:hypothetical protein
MTLATGVCTFMYLVRRINLQPIEVLSSTTDRYSTLAMLRQVHDIIIYLRRYMATVRHAMSREICICGWGVEGGSATARQIAKTQITTDGRRKRHDGGRRKKERLAE